MRFMGINARLGYQLQDIPAPWQVTLMGGIYYATSFVSTNEFGFSGVLGPQVYPVVRYALSNGDQWVGYAKFSPVAGDLGLLSLQSREVAAGLSYILRASALALSADLSELVLSFDEPEVYRMQCRTFSLGLSRFF